MGSLPDALPEELADVDPFGVRQREGDVVAEDSRHPTQALREGCGAVLAPFQCGAEERPVPCVRVFHGCR